MLWIQDPRGATDPCPSRGAADVASGSSGSSSSPEAVWAMAYVCYPLQRAQSSFCFKQRYVVLILPSFYLLLQPAESLSSSTSKFAICAGACHYDSLPPPVTPGPLFGRFMHPRSLTSQPWTRWRTRCFSEPLRWCFSGPKRDPNGTKHTHTHTSRLLVLDPAQMSSSPVLPADCSHARSNQKPLLSAGLVPSSAPSSGFQALLGAARCFRRRVWHPKNGIQRPMPRPANSNPPGRSTESRSNGQ